MIAKGSGYIHGNRDVSRAKLLSHFKYIEQRSREHSQKSRDDRSIFSKDKDVVNRRDAANDVMEHISTSIHLHKVILSPDEDEPISDWRAWTRQVMYDLEEAQGKQLHWYAVYHSDTEHPHVHIIVAGAGYNQEKVREEPIKLHAKDYALLRTSGHEHSDHDFYRLIEEQFQELNNLDHTINYELKSLQPDRAISEDIEQ